MRILIIVSADYYDREHCEECVGAGVGIVSGLAALRGISRSVRLTAGLNLTCESAIYMKRWP